MFHLFSNNNIKHINFLYATTLALNDLKSFVEEMNHSIRTVNVLTKFLFKLSFKITLIEKFDYPANKNQQDHQIQLYRHSNSDQI